MTRTGESYCRKSLSVVVAISLVFPTAARGAPDSADSPAMTSALDRLTAIAADEAQRPNLVDEQLSVISGAIEAGEFDVARDLLVDVTQYFETLFSAEGFQKADRKALRSVVGKGESEKYFIGDPYEQLFAFLYLGMLDMQYGDLDFARASFKAAAYADKQSSNEGKDVDCYMAFALEGLANAWMGRENDAAAAFEQARRAFRFREIAGQVSRAYTTGHNEMISSPALTPDKSNSRTQKRYKVRRDNLFLVGYEQADLSVLLDESPALAVQNSFASARMSITSPQKKSPQENYIESFSEKKAERLDAAKAVLTEFEEKVLANLSATDEEESKRRQASFDTLLSQLSDPGVNVVVVHARGRGPTKVMGGELGEKLEFAPHPYDGTSRTVHVAWAGNGNPLASFDPTLIESVDYQATTRGGRAIDQILARRAVNTKRTVTAGKALKGLGILAALIGSASDNEGVAAAGLLATAVGATIEHVAPVVANTKVDTRCWSELPKEFFVSTHRLEPGEYEMRLADAPGPRFSTTFKVPAQGKIFVLFSAASESTAQPIPEASQVLVASAQPSEAILPTKGEVTDETVSAAVPAEALAPKPVELTAEDKAVPVELAGVRPAPDTDQPVAIEVAATRTFTANVEQGKVVSKPTSLEVPLALGAGLSQPAGEKIGNGAESYSYVEVSYPFYIGANFPIAIAIDGGESVILQPGEKRLTKLPTGEHTVRIGDPLPKRRQRPNWDAYDVRVEAGRFEYWNLRLVPAGPKSGAALQVQLSRYEDVIKTLVIPAR